MMLNTKKLFLTDDSLLKNQNPSNSDLFVIFWLHQISCASPEKEGNIKQRSNLCVQRGRPVPGAGASFYHPDNHTSNPPSGAPASPPWPGLTASRNELLILEQTHLSLNTSAHVFSASRTQFSLSSCSPANAFPTPHRGECWTPGCLLLGSSRTFLWWFLKTRLFSNKSSRCIPKKTVKKSPNPEWSLLVCGETAKLN